MTKECEAAIFQDKKCQAQALCLTGGSLLGTGPPCGPSFLRWTGRGVLTSEDGRSHSVRMPPSCQNWLFLAQFTPLCINSAKLAPPSFKSHLCSWVSAPTHWRVCVLCKCTEGGWRHPATHHSVARSFPSRTARGPHPYFQASPCP